jgi:hypothetical protein
MTSQPANSPFIIGVCEDSDSNLEPLQLEARIDAAVEFLRYLKHLLPHTDVELMMDGRCEASRTIAAAAAGLGIAVMDRSGAPLASVTDCLIGRSSLLLALWDGHPSSNGNDTAAAITRFLGLHSLPTIPAQSANTAHSDHSDGTERAVYWVPMARRDSGSAELRPPCYLVAAGEDMVDMHESMPPSLQRPLAELDEFNLEFQRFTAAGNQVHPSSLMSNLPAELTAADTAVLQSIDRQFVKADSLAGHMQWRSDRLFNLFGVMAFAMGLAYLIYDKVSESRALLITYLLVLIGSLFAYYVLSQRRWLGKHLSYRALAETLRVRFYLALAQLDRRKLAGELIALAGVHRFRGFGLIELVLDAIEPMPSAGTQHAADAHWTRGEFIEEAWVETQYRYFVRKVAQLERSTLRVKFLKTAMFGAAVVVTLVMFIFGDALHGVGTLTGLPVKNVLTFCSGFLAALLGVWELGQNKMATRELLWQYRNQLRQFARARTRLRHLKSRRSRENLLMALGANSLMETYLWAIHRYHREHSPPGAQ